VHGRARQARRLNARYRIKHFLSCFPWHIIMTATKWFGWSVVARVGIFVLISCSLPPPVDTPTRGSLTLGPGLHRGSLWSIHSQQTNQPTDRPRLNPVGQCRPRRPLKVARQHLNISRFVLSVGLFVRHTNHKLPPTVNSKLNSRNVPSFPRRLPPSPTVP